MTNMDIVQDILKQFGKIIDLEPLALNEEGSCRLVFDGDTELNLELDDASDSLLLISPVAPAHEDMFADLLELNLFWAQMHGARFVLLREAGVVALMRRLAVNELDTPTFESALESFLTTVDIWSKAFEETEKRSTQEEKPTAPPQGVRI